MNRPILLPEWSAQQSVLLAWPHSNSDWSSTLTDIEKVYCELTWSISRFQTVLILCLDTTHQKHISEQITKELPGRFPIHFVHAPYNDTWVRDYGPISCCNENHLVLLNFQFNAWGNKYPSSLDNAVNRHLQSQLYWPKTDMQDVDFVLEGGSIETDGVGTLLTTTQCLMNANRNPGYAKNDTEKMLNQYLGIDRVLWLENGYLAGDDTDSHIDTLARFGSDKQIIYMTCEQKTDEHYFALKKMQKELQQFRTKDNLPYELIPIEIPPAIYHPEGYRLPASYVNFLVLNDAVLVPTYRSPKYDEKAVASLVNIFSDREIVTIDCYPMIMQHGSLHCATMQLHAQQCDSAQ